jgi:hypothetical protein
MMLSVRLSVCLCYLVLAAGCASLNEVRFTVDPSGLDYAQFRISRASAIDGKAETIRIDLSGSGFLEMTTGQSERVTESFWQPSDNPNWQDLHRTHEMLSADETTAIFQQLVDLGMFDRKQPEEATPPPHDLAILAQIGFKKRLILTSRKDYRELFDKLEQRCRNPLH